MVAELKCATELVTHFKQAAKPGIVGASAQLSLAAAYQHAGDTYRKAKNTKGATLTYTRAAQTYEELIAELAKPDSRFVTTAEERAKVPTFVSQAQIYRGYCLQRIPATGDEAADKARRDEALACYTDLLKRNPKDALAPHALLQVGTILSGNDDVAGARRALDQLRKEFPESKEAKNAIPMLAAALASSGRTKQAAETYAEMFGNTAAYSTAQFMDAARALDEAGQYDLAVQACDIVLKSGAAAYETAAMLLRTRTLNSAALEAKDDATAAENATKAYLQLEALMEKYGRTTVAIDAELALVTDVAPTVIGLLPKSPALCEAVVFKGTPKDDRPADAQAARNALISEVKNAVKFVTAQRKDYVTAAQLNLAVAQVAEKGFVAARDNGAEPEALREAAGSALNAYTVAMSPGVNPETRQVVPVDDPAVTGYVQAAYVGYIRLAGERARLGADDADRKAFFGDVVTFGNDYLAKFPNGKDAGYVKTQVQIAAQND